MKKPKLKSFFSKLLPVLSLIVMYSCKKSNPTGTDKIEPTVAGTGTIKSMETVNVDQLTDPRTINLVPGQSKTSNTRRIFLPIMQVGSNDVKIKMMFDTGSEGMIVQGKSVLPPAMVADTGVVITEKDSLVVNGITVTRTKLSASYGKTGERTFYGNIAYATFKIGDNSGNVKTKRMPFLLIYKGVDNDSHTSIPVDTHSDGIAGVYSSGTPLTGLVTKRTDLKSPFGYVDFGPGLHAGFKLSQLSLVNWDNVTSYDAPAQPLLSVGINDQSRTGFIFQAQSVKKTGLLSPNLTAMLSINGAAAVQKAILLDTGTPNDNTIYTDVANQTTMADSTQVSFNTTQGFSYLYTNDQKRYVTKLYPLVSNPSRDAIYSINFFLKNAFLLDFTTHEIGLKSEL